MTTPVQHRRREKKDSKSNPIHSQREGQYSALCRRLTESRKVRVVVASNIRWSPAKGDIGPQHPPAATIISTAVSKWNLNHGRLGPCYRLPHRSHMILALLFVTCLGLRSGFVRVLCRTFVCLLEQEPESFLPPLPAQM